MLRSPPPTLVLASTSAGRRALFAAAGIEVSAEAPTCDEASINGTNPAETAQARGVAKAESLARPGAIVIGADQVCHLDGRVFSKPRDAADHRIQLRALRGRTHTLSNGVAVVHEGGTESWITDVRVTLRDDLGDDEIDDYVASGEARDCAGGYRVEGLGARLISRVDGDQFAVVGLPLFEVITVLRRLGWRPAPLSHKPGLPLQGQHP